MKAHIRERLIEALESGRYHQGKGLIKYVNRRGQLCHCALGVLGELYQKATSGNRGKFIELKPKELADLFAFQSADQKKARSVFVMMGLATDLPDRVFKWAGMSDAEATDLLVWNDKGQKFHEIAYRLRRQGIALNVRRKENTHGKAGS